MYHSLYVKVSASTSQALTLGLDGVKEGEEVGVQLLVVWVTQGGDGERLQVQQLRGWRELLREDEVAERHRQLRLRAEPLVRDHSDEVLRGQGLEDGHEKADDVLVMRVLRLEQEVLVMEDELRVNILYQDPECLQDTYSSYCDTH